LSIVEKAAEKASDHVIPSEGKGSAFRLFLMRQSRCFATLSITEK